MYSPVITAPVCCHEFVMKREEEEEGEEGEKEEQTSILEGEEEAGKRFFKVVLKNYLTLSSAHFVHR